MICDYLIFLNNLSCPKGNLGYSIIKMSCLSLSHSIRAPSSFPNNGYMFFPSSYAAMRHPHQSFVQSVLYHRLMERHFNSLLLQIQLSKKLPYGTYTGRLYRTIIQTQRDTLRSPSSALRAVQLVCLKFLCFSEGPDRQTDREMHQHTYEYVRTVVLT